MFKNIRISQLPLGLSIVTIWPKSPIRALIEPLNESVNLGPFINEPIIGIQLAQRTFGKGLLYLFKLMPLELKIHIHSG